jgi:hypothetical protein
MGTKVYYQRAVPIKTDPNYWDCECDTDFIHSKVKGTFCPKCRTKAEDQPDSRKTEIKYQYDPALDIAVKKEANLKGKLATLKVSESGLKVLKQTLSALTGSIFQYDDQDGSHRVILLDVGDAGLVTLIDCNKRTGGPLKGAVEYTVSLYDDGVLTYL